MGKGVTPDSKFRLLLMMTAEQRYLFDLHGYLHLKNALSDEEVASARAAAERYTKAPLEELPKGFSLDGKRHRHGFAFDRALEQLALHPSIWAIVKELTNNKPRLTSGTLQVNPPNKGAAKPLRLHCARDDFGWESVRYEVRDGRVFCDNLVLFPYLTDVYPGDGGLLVVPGSHKAMFERPPELFNNGVIESLEALPEGVVNITPKAGDFIVMNEALTHGALPWLPTDRERIMLVLRYHVQYRDQREMPKAIVDRLLPDTAELIARAGFTDVKDIVRNL
jgi:ectoine hydroxylase-related dioxygenase (phytanoyl-CoA dioxygenase family)